VENAILEREGVIKMKGMKKVKKVKKTKNKPRY